MPRKLVLLLPLLICCFTIFLMASCGSTSCSKSVPCPGYNDTLLNRWFPYHDQQRLIFKSSNNLYDTFHLKLGDSTVPYQYNTGFNRPSTGCSATKMLHSTEIDFTGQTALTIVLTQYSPDYSTTENESAIINFSSNKFEGQTLTFNGFTNFILYTSVESFSVENTAPQTLINYSLNGITYALAQSVTNDSAFAKNIPGVYKFIYARNAGIIEFETNPGNITWVKQ